MAELMCLGEALIEFNAQGDGSYISCFGGDVSNVAIAAARQGAKVGLMTHIGADRFGDDLTALWHTEGIDTQNVKSIEGLDTGLYFVHHSDVGHAFTYRRKGSACSQMTTADIAQAAIAQARVFYTSGIALAISETLRAATFDAFTTAKRHCVTIAFDPNLRESLWSLEQARAITHDAMGQCDIALPGLDDARRLTGLQSPEDIIGFYQSLGAKVVALTLGAQGVAVSDGAGISFVPGVPVKAVDATGAGDCFNGIFLANYLNGVNPIDAAHAANIGAALSTTTFGAVAPIPSSSDIKTRK